MVAIQPRSPDSNLDIAGENHAHIEQEPNGRYKVLWVGWWYGGLFRHESDAILLRDWLLAQSDEDAMEWKAIHEPEQVRPWGWEEDR